MGTEISTVYASDGEPLAHMPEMALTDPLCACQHTVVPVRSSLPEMDVGPGCSQGRNNHLKIHY